MELVGLVWFGLVGWLVSYKAYIWK